MKKDWDLFITLQFISTIVTLALLIWYGFNNKVLMFLQFFLGLTLIIMGINNYRIYKKKLNTIVYCIIGGLLLALTFFLALGV